ncbi:hypothetical protein KBD81_02430 [Candidatus Woesebacteria bacterium]|nr:hypothetical protein [Candidatus Woesebacteria bacterium]
MKLKIFLIIALAALIASSIFAINSFPKKQKFGEIDQIKLSPEEQAIYDKIQPME